MLNLNSIMIGSHQPAIMAEFYQKVFGRKADMVDGDWNGWSVGSTFFSCGSHSEIKGASKEPARMILNLETKEIEEEFDRIKNLGATVVKELYEMEGANGMKIATFADPDGNYFQLMTPWDSK